MNRRRNIGQSSECPPLTREMACELYAHMVKAVDELVAGVKAIPTYHDRHRILLETHQAEITEALLAPFKQVLVNNKSFTLEQAIERVKEGYELTHKRAKKIERISTQEITLLYELYVYLCNILNEHVQALPSPGRETTPSR